MLWAALQLRSERDSLLVATATNSMEMEMQAEAGEVAPAPGALASFRGCCLPVEPSGCSVVVHDTRGKSRLWPAADRDCL